MNAKRNEYLRRLRARRKAEGLCLECPRPREEGMMCARHAAYNRDHAKAGMRRLRARRRATRGITSYAGT